MNRLKNEINDDEIILNTHYIRPKFDREKDKKKKKKEYFPDYLMVVFKNIKTGKKRIKMIREPMVPVFIAQKGKDFSEYREFAPKSDLDMKWVRYWGRERRIASDLLHFNKFGEKVAKGELETKHINLDKRVFGSDIHIEDMAMKIFFKNFLKKDDTGKIAIDFPKLDHFDIGGLDIETDINVSDEASKQPVIANTAIDNKSWKVVTWCLINENYQGQKEVMEDIEGFKKEFKEVLYNHIENIDIDEDDPVKKAKKEEQVKAIIHNMANQLTLDLQFTHNEKKVISEPTEFLFKKARPDICYIYNAQFDIGHMELRSKVLGLDFAKCFEYKDTKYIDFNYSSENPDPKKREHYYNAFNPTKIVDQLLQYAQLRRSKLFASYSLDAVTKREIGVAKLDYSKIVNYIGDFPYKDFKTFIIYNIIDVFMMLVLDRMTNDCYSQIYSRFNLCTEWGRIAKPMKRTVNVFDTLADVQGYIAGNEINALFVDMKKKRLDQIADRDPSLYNVIMQLKAANTSDKKDNPYRIQGGCVAEPTKIRPGVAVNNIFDFDVKQYRKLKNCADLDAASMYPNNIIANNGSKTTLFGILQEVNGVSDDNVSQRGALALLNENFVEVGNVFFGLPNAEKLIQDYYNVKPVYKKRVEEIEGFCSEAIEFDSKNKFMERYRKLLNKLYNTKFNEKDVEGGAPPLNKYFFSADSNYIRFVYYDTLIEMFLEGPGTFNENNGFPGVGFVCGDVLIKDSLIRDKHQDYIECMMPRKHKEQIGHCIYRDELSREALEEIKLSKVKPFDLQLGPVKFNTMGRLVFWNSEECNRIKYEVHDVINEKGGISNKGVILKLLSEYNLDNEHILKITQSIMLFRG